MSHTSAYAAIPPLEQASPLLAKTGHAEPSLFDPANMLREARRQKQLLVGDVPGACLLDPDGDIVDFVRDHRGAVRSPHWACYHTELWEWVDAGVRYGVVGRAVGAPFAVLVAEQLFVSGCSFVVSLASAGRIAGQDASERYIIVDRALRDEGTSHHYLQAAEFAYADPKLVAAARRTLGLDPHIEVAATWTTDAPFRETAQAISESRRRGAVAVEMEAAALYAFAEAKRRPLLCVAHLTNCLGLIEGDFEKGEANGAARSLAIATKLLRIPTPSEMGDPAAHDPSRQAAEAPVPHLVSQA
jgi:uridine phosphorylase